MQLRPPFRTSLGGRTETSLHCPHWEDNGFLLRSVLDYSDTNPDAVHPECGGNTPVIFEHHRKHTTASRGRIKPPCCTRGSKQRLAAGNADKFKLSEKSRWRC